MSNFVEREKRLTSVLVEEKITKHLPLFNELKIDEELFIKLKSSCHLYLKKSLEVFLGQEITSNDILVDHKSDVKSLPNMTPNGLLLPKAENLKEYNDIHRVVADIFQCCSIGELIELVHCPINVRIVSGEISDKDFRPRASQKLHSDIWAGEFSNSLMVFLACMGDNANGIEFMEPTEEFLEYLHPLKDYLEGANLEKSSTKYDCKIESGFAYFTDPFLLHRTIKKTPNLRLSIDFRFIPKTRCETDRHIDTERYENYISLNEWNSIGRNLEVYTSESILTAIADAQKTRQNSYAAKFEVRSSLRNTNVGQ